MTPAVSNPEAPIVENESPASLAANETVATVDRATHAAGPTRSPARLRQSRINAAMRVLRKIHLYSGIFMFPWVMIYGVSALLFNHPLLFSDNPVVKSFGPEATAGTPLAAFPAPEALAREVVAAMESAGREAGAATAVTLAEPTEAKFARPQATVTTTGDRQRFTVALDLDGQGGSVRARRDEPPGGSPAVRPSFATTNLAIETPALAKVREAASAVLERIDVPGREAMNVALPDLTFRVEADGRPWIVNYNFERRSATARPADVPASTLTARSYLTKLHLVHGYPDSFTAKTLWCVAVDAMFASMVFWGVSGMLMWWQLKATRGAGLAFVVVSAITATILMVGMHQEFINTPPRNEAGPNPGASSNPGGRGERGPRGENTGERGRRGGTERSEAAERGTRSERTADVPRGRAD